LACEDSGCNSARLVFQQDDAKRAGAAQGRMFE
jgi:hypothetical protein